MLSVTLLVYLSLHLNGICRDVFFIMRYQYKTKKNVLFFINVV